MTDEEVWEIAQRAIRIVGSWQPYDAEFRRVRLNALGGFASAVVPAGGKWMLGGTDTYDDKRKFSTMELAMAAGDEVLRQKGFAFVEREGVPL